MLRVACLTLLRKANATLTLIPPLLQDKQFRAAFTADLDDPEGLRGFWQWYEIHPAAAALAGHRPRPGPAARRSCCATSSRRTIGAPAARASTCARSSTAASCSPGCPKGRSARRPPGCWARSSSPRRGRPPPPGPGIAEAAPPRRRRLHRRGAELPHPARLGRRHARRGPRLPASPGPGPPEPGPDAPRDPAGALRQRPQQGLLHAARRKTPTSWPGTPCPNSTSTTCPTWTPTRPRAGSSSTAAKPPRSPCAPTRHGRWSGRRPPSGRPPQPPAPAGPATGRPSPSSPASTTRRARHDPDDPGEPDSHHDRTTSSHPTGRGVTQQLRHAAAGRPTGLHRAGAPRACQR